MGMGMMAPRQQMMMPDNDEMEPDQDESSESESSSTLGSISGVHVEMSI